MDVKLEGSQPPIPPNNNAPTTFGEDEGFNIIFYPVTKQGKIIGWRVL